MGYCLGYCAGADTINAGNGPSKIIFAGALGDTVTSGDGDDLICGDHCYAKFRTTQDYVGPTGNFTIAAGVPWQLDYVVTIDPLVTGGTVLAR